MSRLGVESGDPGFLEEMGASALDCTPIDVDMERVEGWDTGAVDPDRPKTIAKRVHRVRGETSAQLQARQEGGG